MSFLKSSILLAITNSAVLAASSGSLAIAEPLAIPAPTAIEFVEAPFDKPEFMTKTLTVTRFRGDAYIDGERIQISNATEGDWRVELISKLEGIEFKRPVDFSRWIRKLPGTQVFEYETVTNTDGSYTPIPLVSNDRRSDLSNGLEMHRSRLSAMSASVENDSTAHRTSPSTAALHSMREIGLSRYLVSLQPNVQNNYNRAFAGARFGPLGALHFPNTQTTNRIVVTAFDSGEVIREVQNRYPGFQITGVRNLTSSN
ncbi:MAG: hypothetical protein AAF664_14000 [Planctomycetota bacterium]